MSCKFFKLYSLNISSSLLYSVQNPGMETPTHKGRLALVQKSVLIAAMLLLISGTALAQSPGTPPATVGAIVTTPTATIAQRASKRANHGIVISDMDPAVTPGNDFFAYTVGGWMKHAQIPPDGWRAGVYADLDQQSRKDTAALIAEAAKANAPAGSNPRKIADVYNSYMDQAGIEAKGLTPLRSQLEMINAIHDRHDLALALGESLRADVDPLNQTNFYTANLFGLWVAPGFNSPDRYTAYLLQGGLMLPSRDYYLSSSPHLKELAAKYQTHVAAMLKLAGFADSDTRAAQIVALERSIAEKQIDLTESQDINKANNTWTKADFSTKAPGLDWKAYFRGAGLSQQHSFIVWQPTAFTGESALVDTVSVDTWKDWSSPTTSLTITLRFCRKR